MQRLPNTDWQQTKRVRRNRARSFFAPDGLSQRIRWNIRWSCHWPAIRK